MVADHNIPEALASLGQTETTEEETYQVIEEYICYVFLRAPKFKALKELRFFFTKIQVESVSMPPTQAALRPAIQRAHYQTIIWQQAHVPRPQSTTTDRLWMGPK